MRFNLTVDTLGKIRVPATRRQPGLVLIRWERMLRRMRIEARTRLEIVLPIRPVVQGIQMLDFVFHGVRESNSQIFDMLSPSSTDTRIAEIAKIAETKGGLASLQQHLKEVIEGDVFKGSHRSGQFLQYIVDQAIAGRFDSLKERVIGMELFGRSASYDTGDDAIVRVTASDVRKRLLQHYGRYGATSGFRISLPSGSYIPEILRDPLGEFGVSEVATKPHDAGPPLQESALVADEPVVNASAFLPLET